jgi:hypothetical protein
MHCALRNMPAAFLLLACSAHGSAHSGQTRSPAGPVTDGQATLIVAGDVQATHPADPALHLSPPRPLVRRLSPLVHECERAQPEWIWCDDFDVDRIASYFEYSSASGRFVRVPDGGVDGSGAMRGRFDAGTVGAGSLKIAFGETPARYFRAVDDGITRHREIYYRHFVYFPAGWRGGVGHKLSRATSMVDSNWAQAMIAHIWSGRDELYMDPASGTDVHGTVITTKYNDFDRLRWLGARRGPTPLARETDTWHCVEVRVRLNDAGRSNGVFEFWVNDRLQASRTDLNWLGAYDRYGINAVFLENYWNDGAPRSQERFIDNFVVSSGRIGCG